MLTQDLSFKPGEHVKIIATKYTKEAYPELIGRVYVVQTVDMQKGVKITTAAEWFSFYDVLKVTDALPVGSTECFCTTALECSRHSCEPPSYESVLSHTIRLNKCVCRALKRDYWFDLAQWVALRDKDIEAFPEIVDVNNSLDYTSPLERFRQRKNLSWYHDFTTTEEKEEEKERVLLERVGEVFPSGALPPLLDWPPIWIHVAELEDGRIFPGSPRLSQEEAVLAAKNDVLADRERVNERSDPSEDDELGDATYVIGKLTKKSFRSLVIMNPWSEAPYVPRHRFEVKVRQLQLAERWRRSHAIRSQIVLQHCSKLRSAEVRKMILDFLIGPDWQRISKCVWIDGRLQNRVFDVSSCEVNAMRNTDPSDFGVSGVENVIDEVRDVDQGTHIDAAEAAALQDELWASSVERLLASSGGASSSDIFQSSLLETSETELEPHHVELTASEVVSSSAATSAAISVFSAPCNNVCKQCLLFDAQVLSVDRGLVEARHLQVGEKLRSSQFEASSASWKSVDVEIASILHLPSRDRDVADIRFSHAEHELHSCTVIVTDSHEFAGKRRDMSAWSGVAAAELSKNHVVLGAINKATSFELVDLGICGATSLTRHIEVVEVTFKNSEAVVWVKNGELVGVGHVFAAVLGSPPRDLLRCVERHGFLQIQSVANASQHGRRSCVSEPERAPHAVRVHGFVCPPHIEGCKNWCKYYMQGKCKKGSFCRYCHHPDHLDGPLTAPPHRGRRPRKR